MKKFPRARSLLSIPSLGTSTKSAWNSFKHESNENSSKFIEGMEEAFYARVVCLYYHLLNYLLNSLNRFRRTGKIYIITLLVYNLGIPKLVSEATIKA